MEYNASHDSYDFDLVISDGEDDLPGPVVVLHPNGVLVIEDPIDHWIHEAASSAKVIPNSDHY